MRAEEPRPTERDRETERPRATSPRNVRESPKRKTKIHEENRGKTVMNAMRWRLERVCGAKGLSWPQPKLASHRHRAADGRARLH